MVGDVVEEMQMNMTERALKVYGEFMQWGTHALTALLFKEKQKRKEDHLNFGAYAHSVKKCVCHQIHSHALRVLEISKAITSAKLPCAWLPKRKKKKSSRPNHAPRSCVKNAVVLRADHAAAAVTSACWTKLNQTL